MVSIAFSPGLSLSLVQSVAYAHNHEVRGRARPPPPITAAIPRLISTGTTERDLLAVVARKFPELTRTKFLAAQAKRKALRLRG